MVHETVPRFTLKTPVRTTESTADTEKRRKHTNFRRTQPAEFPYFVTPDFFSVITVSSVVNCFSRLIALILFELGAAALPGVSIAACASSRRTAQAIY
ncbi:MAG: hypothetical protein Q8J96_01985 [Rhodocyclaceae bacterium]|nr:hypothetical protein [Rhodocyclaceae bacterium]